jgi:hypothetical protein
VPTHGWTLESISLAAQQVHPVVFFPLFLFLLRFSLLCLFALFRNRPMLTFGSQLGLSASLHGLFPRGAVELVEHFERKCNRQLAERLASRNLARYRPYLTSYSRNCCPTQEVKGEHTGATADRTSDAARNDSAVPQPLARGSSPFRFRESVNTSFFVSPPCPGAD